jgi:hypothetical protein
MQRRASTHSSALRGEGVDCRHRLWSGPRMERSEQRQAHHLGLATVCALVYHATTGQIPDPRRPEEMDAIFNDIAAALSRTVRIFSPDPGCGVPKRISAIDLIEGNFSRSAQVFTFASGRELRGLSVQRGDMETAIVVFRAARISFRARRTD